MPPQFLPLVVAFGTVIGIGAALGHRSIVSACFGVVLVVVGAVLLWQYLDCQTIELPADPDPFGFDHDGLPEWPWDRPQHPPYDWARELRELGRRAA